MYFVMKGAFVEFTLLESGDEEIICSYSPGDHFGEIALLTEERRGSSVKAVAFSNILFISKEEFDNLLVRWCLGGSRPLLFSCEV